MRGSIHSRAGKFVTDQVRGTGHIGVGNDENLVRITVVEYLQQPYSNHISLWLTAEEAKNLAELLLNVAKEKDSI